METNGAAWGARRDVVMRAASALSEWLESVATLHVVRGPAEAAVTFDEFNLDVEVSYEGQPMAFPAARPTTEALLEDVSAVVSLSGFIIGKYADTLQSESVDGRCRVLMHFDH
jgi:xanthine permease XanP